MHLEQVLLADHTFRKPLVHILQPTSILKLLRDQCLGLFSQSWWAKGRISLRELPDGGETASKRRRTWDGLEVVVHVRKRVYYVSKDRLGSGGRHGEEGKGKAFDVDGSQVKDAGASPTRFGWTTSPCLGSHKIHLTQI